MLIVCGSERWTRCPINHEKANWTALAGTVPRPLSHPVPPTGRRVSSTWQTGPPPPPARADRRSGQRASQLNGRLLAFGLNLIKPAPAAAAAVGGGEGQHSRSFWRRFTGWMVSGGSGTRVEVFGTRSNKMPGRGWCG